MPKTVIAGPHAEDRLEDDGDQVRLGVVVFAERAVHGAAAGVEVAQGGELELLPFGVAVVLQDLLDHQLAAAVGRDRGFLLVFGDGDLVRVAVDGAGAGEDEAGRRRLPASPRSTLIVVATLFW